MVCEKTFGSHTISQVETSSQNAKPNRYKPICTKHCILDFAPAFFFTKKPT